MVLPGNEMVVGVSSGMGQAHPLTPTRQLGLIWTNACTSKDLSFPTSAFLCGVYTDREARQAQMLVFFRMCGSQLVAFGQVSVSP